jgi:hypothetical protein
MQGCRANDDVIVYFLKAKQWSPSEKWEYIYIGKCRYEIQEQ